MRIPLALLLPLLLVPFACGGTDASSNAATPDAGSSGDDGGGTTGDDGATTGDDGGTTADTGAMPDTGPPFMMAPHPPYPVLMENGGNVLNNMTLVTIVASNEDPSVASALFALADSFQTGSYYSTVGADYGLGTIASSVHVTGAAMTTNPSPTQMINYIATSIQGHTIGARPFYMLYLPEGIWDTDGQGNVNTNCALGHGGYHSVTNSGAPWGLAVHCSGLSRIQGLGVFGSHEIVEGASDPNPSTGWRLPQPSGSAPWNTTPWTSGAQGENGDLCTGTSIYVGGYKLQRIWSTTAAAKGGDPCLPAIADPYYSVSAPQGWYTVAAGGSVQIPLTGFSDKARTDWYLDASALVESAAGWTVTVTSATKMSVGGMMLPSINNGRTATLNVTAPNTHGAWVNIWVYSLSTVSGSDQYHWWPVGVHVL